MSFFDLDPTATQNLMDQARMNPLDPETLKPGWFAGTWKAPVTGIAAAVTDATLLAGDAAPAALRPVARPVDQLFGTKLEDTVNKIPDYALQASQFTTPDPRTMGVVGQAVHGFFNIGTEALAGGPETAAVLQGYKSYRFGMADGLDPGTALGKGAIDGISTWVGLKIPMTVAPMLGAVGTVGTGAAGNLATGMATRGATAELLRARGFNDMAEQYQVMDSSAIAADLIMGGGFGALAHYGPAGFAKYQEWKAKNDGKLLPSDKATAAYLNAMLHTELDTAPGIPTDPAARQAHAEALAKSIEDMMAGRDVNVGEQVASSNFIENPTAAATRQAIGEAVTAHIGDLGTLQDELASRGLPSDPTLYSVQGPRDMVPAVRPTTEVKGIVDRATKEGWDNTRILAELETLAGKLDARNDARSGPRDRVRGSLWIDERLTRAQRNGELSADAVGLAKWLIEKNPHIGDDLSLSIRESKGDQVGGMYKPLERLAVLFKGGGDELTAAHEILHHTERMMPTDVQQEIRKAWLAEVKRVRDGAEASGNQNLALYINDVIKANLGMEMNAKNAIEAIKQGLVNENAYALFNPSEFWAVKASQLVRERANEAWVKKAMQWVKELMEKAKDLFGLRSDASIIRGLDSVLQSEGFQSANDLTSNYSPKFNVEAPGKGVAKENLNGFEPDLRVNVPIGRMKLPEKPLLLTGTNKKNAARQIAAIDDILAKFPNADTSPLEWSKMMAYAFATHDVVIPPYRFLKDINSDGAFKSLSRLSAGQIADATHGFENAKAFREAYLSKELDVETTGKLFAWSFLSRGVSPYTQEGLFIDAFHGLDEWVQKAAAGNLTEADFPAYEAWASSVAPKGSGQPGSGATHNLNAFGKLFLFKMGQKDENGVSLLQTMHNMMEDPNMTGQQIRRWFIQNTEGVGIDNKVVSFTLLVAGFPDVMVLDRVQIRQLWDDGRFGDRNLYDGRKVDGKPVAGSALSEITYGARGLLIYEAIERALAKRVENLYTSLGRPEDASIGRYHWETWVADSQQEASHGTLDAILHDAKGDSAMIAEVTAKEGEYGAYAYGARYGRDASGPYFLYSTPGGSEYRFTVPAFREFMDAVKSPANKVVPTKFKVTEAGNAPWFEKAEVNKQALDDLAKRYSGEPGTGQGEGAVQATGSGQAVPDQPGRGTDAYAPETLMRSNPAMTYIQPDGTMVPAARALAAADEEIASAQRDSQGYDAAVACALRG